MNIIEEINAGLHDLVLADLAKAVEARSRKIRMSHSKDDFNVGDRVVFNTMTGTKYMQGREGTIVSKKQKKVVVVMDKPVGRFAIRTADGSVRSAEITCPPAILDKI